MNRTLNARAALPVVIAVVAFMLFPAHSFSQSKAFTITPIVKRGDPSPVGEPFFSCEKCTGQLPGIHAFNNRGDLILETTGGLCYTAFYLISAGNKTLLFDGCHPTLWGVLGLGDAALNNRGRIALTAYASVNNLLDKNLLFLYEDGELTRLVADGDPTPSGDVFSRLSLIDPHINDSGDIIFEGISVDPGNNERADIYLYSDGKLRSLVTSGSPSPIGGAFSFVRLDTTPQINNEGDVLFYSSVLYSPVFGTSGLFIITSDEARKVVADGDDLPAGIKGSVPQGSFNDHCEVAFSSNTGNLYFEDQGGIYTSSGGQIHKLISVGDPTPIGGKFAPFGRVGENYQIPRINNVGAVAFKAAVKNGASPLGIFLSSPNAIVKVVAAGDRADGRKIASIDTYAMNDFGEIAFVALDKRGQTLGVFKATPVAPAINSIKLKHKRQSLELRVDASVMITGNSLIEINGVRVGAIDYPSDFREDGGLTTRVISRDDRLEQLIPAGQTVLVTVLNPLTNTRSAAVAFTR